MKKLLFYEKPGCRGNARQKALLEANGYTLVVKSILDEPWERDTLRSFFAKRPVAEWFNDKAPSIKQGRIDPGAFDAEGALDIMLREPILIRRPLIELNGKRVCGFDDEAQAMLNISKISASMEACQNDMIHSSFL